MDDWPAETAGQASSGIPAFAPQQAVFPGTHRRRETGLPPFPEALHQIFRILLNVLGLFTHVFLQAGTGTPGAPGRAIERLEERLAEWMRAFTLPGLGFVIEMDNPRILPHAAELLLGVMAQVPAGNAEARNAEPR